MKNFILCVLFFVTLQLTAFSQIVQNNTAQILLKGTITDEFTGEPIAVNIEFQDTEGKKINIFSNSLTGHFEQILTAGRQYKVKFTKENILRKEFSYTTMESKKYAEDSIKWNCKKLAVDAKLFEFDLFENGSSQLSENGKSKLMEIQDVLKFNRSIYLNFAVQMNDSYQDDKKTPQSKLLELFNLRIASIKDFINNWNREKSKIEFQTTYTLDKKLKNTDDLIIKISKIQDLFGK